MDFKQIVIEEAKKANLKIVTAESLTGGMIASSLVMVSGASSAFAGGIISYSNEVKMKLLNVKKETLDTFGAVSKETAYEMAVGAIKATNSQVAIAVTGNAGPGVLENKAVGKVYMCIVILNKAYEYDLQFLESDRNALRIALTSKAINELGKLLISFNRKKKV